MKLYLDIRHCGSGPSGQPPDNLNSCPLPYAICVGSGLPPGKPTAAKLAVLMAFNRAVAAIVLDMAWGNFTTQQRLDQEFIIDAFHTDEHGLPVGIFIGDVGRVGPEGLTVAALLPNNADCVWLSCFMQAGESFAQWQSRIMRDIAAIKAARPYQPISGVLMPRTGNGWPPNPLLGATALRCAQWLDAQGIQELTLFPNGLPWADTKTLLDAVLPLEG
jgi:hypothetical protein